MTTGSAAGRNLRARLRKARNRFERRGELTVTDRDRARRGRGGVRRVRHHRGQRVEGGHRRAGQPARDRALLRRFLLAAARAGRRAVRTLRLDGRPAAAQLAATTGDTFELMKVAYDDELAELSPSNLLMADLVRTCCERPDVARIDLVTNQPWHARWHAEVHPTYQVARPQPPAPRRAWRLVGLRRSGDALAAALTRRVNLHAVPDRDRHVPRRPRPRPPAHRRLPRRAPRGLRVGRPRRAPVGAGPRRVRLRPHLRRLRPAAGRRRLAGRGVGPARPRRLRARRHVLVGGRPARRPRRRRLGDDRAAAGRRATRRAGR